MLKLLFYCLTITLLNYNTLADEINDENLSVDLVYIVHKSELRYPEKSEAEIINVNNFSIYNWRFGESTDLGIDNERQLGLDLRKRYVGIFGNLTGRIESFSTNTSRTKTSLRAILSIIHNIPFDSSLLKVDKASKQYSYRDLDLLLSSYKNPKFLQTSTKEILASKEFLHKLANYSSFARKMEQFTGKPFKNDILTYGGKAYIALNIHKKLNLTIPSWCTDDVYLTLKELNTLALSAMSLNAKLRKLNGGPLVRIITNGLQSYENDQKIKMRTYSTHITTMAGLVRSLELRLPNNKDPLLSTAIIIEMLSDKNNNKFVRAITWKKPHLGFEVARFRDCDELCPMNNYLNIVNGTIPSDADISFLLSN